MYSRGKLFLALSLSSLLSPSAWAQRGGVLNPIGNNGNIINPGVPLSGGPVVSGPRLGATIPMGGTAASAQPFGSGFAGSNMGSSMRPPIAPQPPGRGGRRGYGPGYGYGGYVIPVPVYGAGYDGFYRSVHNPAPGTYDPIFGVYGGAAFPVQDATHAEPTPSVVINQYFQAETARPQVRDYTNADLPQPGPTQASQVAPSVNSPATELQFYFLIAMNDSTIHAVAAYWVAGSTLNFVDLQGKRGSVPLDRVDRTLSGRLNIGRGVEFELPPQ